MTIELLIAASPPALKRWARRHRPVLTEAIRIARFDVDAQRADDAPIDAPVADVDLTCPDCGDDLEWNSGDAYYGLDVRTGKGQAFVTFHPCCEGMRDRVEILGYERAYGRALVDVVREITGQEVLKVVDEGDGSVVCRLRVQDPTVVGERDELGRAAASSPKGWRDEVFADVTEHHRHHEAPQGWKFGVAVYNGAVRVGVATVGRPLARKLQAARPKTLEVTRVTTWGDAPLRMNASSKLYAAAADQARKLGYTALITYTLRDEESGHSLVASNWVPTHISHPTGKKSWSNAKRPRSGTAPEGPKVRWERGLTAKEQRDVESRRIDLAVSSPVA